jgi:hypothetical protein
MAESSSRLDVFTIARVAGDIPPIRGVDVAAALPIRRRESVSPQAGWRCTERQVKPRRADDATRILLVALSQLIDWRRVLTVVKPDTLIRWHRKGFRLFWRWKSSGSRPRLPAELRELIAETTITVARTPALERAFPTRRAIASRRCPAAIRFVIVIASSRNRFSADCKTSIVSS